MRNTLAEELEVVLGLALFSASESAEKQVSFDAWNKRAEIVRMFLDAGYQIDDIAYPTTAREEGKVEFRLTDTFLEFMVTYFLTTAEEEFYENV